MLLRSVASVIVAWAFAHGAPAFAIDFAAAEAHPDAWPELHHGVALNPSVEKFVDGVIAQMTLEEKIGQMLQADVSTASPDDVRRFGLGSVLAGGNSAPNRDVRGPAADWLALTRSYGLPAAGDSSGGHVAVPPLFGIDAVHGHGHARGATIFPHNTALGAAHDARLVRHIGEATAAEVAATGVDWVFAPTVAVAMDSRWGRSYESYSDDPTLVASYAAAMIAGLQGSTNGRIGSSHVIATLKHFVGDGATQDGRDQGEALIDETELRVVHAAGYVTGVQAGALTVMASYSSWQGMKMHGNRSLLTDVLKRRMGFNGFVIGDWNGQEQVEGCTKFDCPQAVLAGVDMLMAADGWPRLRDNLLAEVRDGTIPLARIDDAVRRILRVKALAGLFDTGNVAQRTPRWNVAALGTPAHRALAREAVSRSLVLLKNDGRVLPLKPHSRVLVAGAAGDDIGQQSGGWTIDWQGDHNQNADFPGATSIYAGLKSAVTAAGGSTELSADGKFSVRPDVAVVVFGERPYAEYDGDREALVLSEQDEAGLVLIRRLREQGIPVVAVLLTGRPLWMNRELNAADAFVVAWLPGTEGAGVADVLVADPHGAARQDFRGRLPFSWPATTTPVRHLAGGAVTGALFARGYGLSYGDVRHWVPLEEHPPGFSEPADSGVLFTEHHVVAPWSLFLHDRIGDLRDTLRTAVSQGRALSVSMGRDGAVVSWHRKEGAELMIAGRAKDLTPAVRPNATLVLTYRVDSAPTGSVFMGVRCGLPYGAAPEVPAGASRHCAIADPGVMRDVTEAFRAQVGSWHTFALPLGCFKGADLRFVGAPFALRTAGKLDVTIKDIRVISAPFDIAQCAALQATRSAP